MAKAKKETAKSKKPKDEPKGTVTKRDLVEALQEKYGGSLADNERWVNFLFETLKDQLSDMGRAEIRGFGVFNVNTIKSHTTVNLKHKNKKSKKYKKLKVPETYTVDFRTSKKYRERLKKDRAATKTKVQKSKK